MTQRSLQTWPAKVLMKRALKVPKEMDIKELVTQMYQTMKEKDGVGLAANQLGELLRVIVISSQGSHITLVNPEIVWQSEDKMTNMEGCLSFPGKQVEVERPKFVKVEAERYDLQEDQRTPITFTATNTLFSLIVQHEIDHLNGVNMYQRAEMSS